MVSSAFESLAGYFKEQFQLLYLPWEVLYPNKTICLHFLAVWSRFILKGFSDVGFISSVPLTTHNTVFVFMISEFSKSLQTPYSIQYAFSKYTLVNLFLLARSALNPCTRRRRTRRANCWGQDSRRRRDRRVARGLRWETKQEVLMQMF